MRQLRVAVTPTTAHKDGGTSTATTGRDTIAARGSFTSRHALFALQHIRLAALIQLGHAYVGPASRVKQAKPTKYDVFCIRETWRQSVATTGSAVARDRATLNANVENLLKLSSL